MVHKNGPGSGNRAPKGWREDILPGFGGVFMAKSQPAKEPRRRRNGGASRGCGKKQSAMLFDAGHYLSPPLKRGFLI